jgi:hypothetical protein
MLLGIPCVTLIVEGRQVVMNIVEILSKKDPEKCVSDVVSQVHHYVVTKAIPLSYTGEKLSVLKTLSFLHPLQPYVITYIPKVRLTDARLNNDTKVGFHLWLHYFNPFYHQKNGVVMFHIT